MASKRNQTISKIDAISDFLEVYIHAILYGRKVYPETLFEDRYAYGVPVKSSRHPELNSYVLGAVLAIKSELLQNWGPCDVMVDIIDDNEKSIEAFVVEIDTVLGDYEPQHDIGLRGALVRLSTLEAPTEQALGEERSFRVCLRPRNGSSGPSLEKDKWVARLGTMAAETGAGRLVPLCAIDSAELKVQAFAQLPRSRGA